MVLLHFGPRLDSGWPPRLFGGFENGVQDQFCLSVSSAVVALALGTSKPLPPQCQRKRPNEDPRGPLQREVTSQ
ncbi:hypothetical protein MHYP_G00168430 [Metynnis hypsauchen]